MIIETADLLRFLLLAACVFFGVMAHILKQVVEYRRLDPKTSLRAYFRTYPYQVAENLVLTIGCSLAIYEVGQFNGITAFLCGFASNSVASSFSSRVEYVRKNLQLGENSGGDDGE